MATTFSRAQSKSGDGSCCKGSNLKPVACGSDTTALGPAADSDIISNMRSMRKWEDGGVP